MIPIIISGGSGERLWPYSRQNMPKQFCELLGSTLLEMCVNRFSRNYPRPYLLYTKTQENILKNKCNLDVGHIVEPEAKNTAAAIALLCCKLLQQGQQGEIVGVFPADHFIGKEKDFHRALQVASGLAEQGNLVTLGIRPHYAATGYGYVELEDISGKLSANVVSFKEKPDLRLAEEYIKKDNFLWNAGIFVFRAKDMISAFQEFMPELWHKMTQLKHDDSNIAEIYKSLRSISIDVGILEKVKNLSCIPCDMDWRDLGSWDELAELEASGLSLQQVGKENVQSISAENNFIFSSKEKTFAMVDVHDLVVVDTGDALLISKKGSTQKVKQIVSQLKHQESSVATEFNHECRPWGKFKSIAQEQDFKFKKITVLPSERLSYQSHKFREEHWIVLEGVAEFTLDDELTYLQKGDHVFIPKNAKHRIENIGASNLVFLEVQTGSYFGEDDIKRYSDDYGRSDLIPPADENKKVA